MMLKRLATSYQTLALLLLNTLVLLVVIEVAAWLLLGWQDRQNRAELIAQQASQGYYANQPWAETYWREHYQQERMYRPYVLWRNTPFQGETINVDAQGYRVTPGASCEAGAFIVFVLGGSTIWGHGAPDWGTIPAYLQNELVVGRDEPVCVRNLGEPAYVSTQSVIELEQQLRQGQRPDLVIFYDGYNDVAAAYQNGRPGSQLNEALLAATISSETTFSTWLQTTNTYQLLTRAAVKAGLSLPGTEATDVTQPASPDHQFLSNVVFQTYFSNYQMVAALAAAYGFDYHFFWQPTRNSWQATNPTSSPIEAFFEEVYARMDNEASHYPCLTNQSHLPDVQTESLWLDPVHPTPPGNQAIAQAIAQTLQEKAAVPPCHANP
jgi:lysophospholipase L1-like esterase